MGQDDANEGHGAGECVEHAWRLEGVTLGFGSVKAAEDYSCIRCGAVTMRQSGPSAG